MFPEIELKLGTMRKPQSFSLMHQSDGTIIGQSDKRIFVLAPANGILRLGGPKGNSFLDLAIGRGAVVLRLDSNQAQPIIDALAPVDPNGTTSLGGGVVYVDNTVQVIG